MRVLIIWAENINRFTGGAMHLMGWRHGMKSIGHEVKVIAPSYAGGRSSFIEDVKYIPLPRRCFLSFFLLQACTVLFLPWWLFRYRPETVFVRTCFLAFLMYPVCRLASVPLILEGGSGPVDEEIDMRGEAGPISRLIKFLGTLNNRFVSAIVCVTEGTRDELIKRGARSETTFVVHNAAMVDIMRTMDQVKARSRLGMPKNGYVVGFAGSLVPWQGLGLLVEAAAEIAGKADRSVHFVLVGDGQCREAIAEKVTRLGLDDDFLFLAPMPFEDIAVFNNACDVVVIPIFDERKLRYGLDPLKFWDAISVGVPVLMSQGCKLESILAELSLPGIFRPGDSGHLGEVILDVLSETEFYKSRRNEVHGMVREKYSWNHIAAQLIDISTKLRLDAT